MVNDLNFIFPIPNKDRNCVYCGTEYFGSRVSCSYECYQMWEEEGKLDPWRKYFQPPYQFFTMSKCLF